ncbi:MAG: hypothetical protein APF76_17920 [Desulfitibacter sp. BRH_c19]|nr:MAG: hypothetical protein APF76_17920 [Desulfitibacter sp. BRH_c19]
MDKALSKGFKALGEPTRLKILKILSVQSMCVCELSEVLDMLQPRVSQHLRILKEADLVVENKEGYFTFYSLNQENIVVLWDRFLEFLNVDLEILQGYEEAYIRLKDIDSNERVRSIKERAKKNKIISI